MAELTHAEYVDPSILHSERWIDLRGDEAIFLDPATGNQLRMDQPPEWLQSDPRLAHGYDLLGRANARGHMLILAYCDHMFARGLDRPRELGLGTPDKGWYERAHKTADAVAWERVGATRDGVQKRIAGYKIHHKRITTPPRTFLDRQHRAVATCEKPVLLPDIPGDSEVPIDRLLFEGIKAVKNYPPDRERRMSREEMRKLYFPLQGMREWYIVGKYMLEAEIQRDIIGDAPVVLFPIGAWHRDMERKFATFNMSVQEVDLLQLGMQRATSLQNATIWRTGRIPRAKLLAEDVATVTKTDEFRRAIAHRRRRIH